MAEARCLARGQIYKTKLNVLLGWYSPSNRVVAVAVNTNARLIARVVFEHIADLLVDGKFQVRVTRVKFLGVRVRVFIY